MNNNVQIFKNTEFGDLRTITIDDEPWFVGKDVAESLGYANESTNHKPKIFNRDCVEIADPEEIYSGCWVQAVVSLYPYNSNGNKGIGVGLLAIRKIKDGESLGGTVVSENDFDDSLCWAM